MSKTNVSEQRSCIYLQRRFATKDIKTQKPATQQPNIFIQVHPIYFSEISVTFYTTGGFRSTTGQLLYMCGSFHGSCCIKEESPAHSVDRKEVYLATTAELCLNFQIHFVLQLSLPPNSLESTAGNKLHSLRSPFI